MKVNDVIELLKTLPQDSEAFVCGNPENHDVVVYVYHRRNIEENGTNIE